MSEFHPKFVGLTGTPTQVEACARKWRVYYTSPEQYESQDRDDYLVDHSVITYLIDPPFPSLFSGQAHHSHESFLWGLKQGKLSMGEFRCFFSKEFTATNIVNHTAKQMEKFAASLKPF